MYVNEAMTTSIIVCKPESSLDEIARKMWDSDCGAVPVLDDAGRPVGIVTDRDIAMSAMLNHRPLWDICAATVTNGRPVYSCGQGESVESCLASMAAHGVRRLPVTDDAGKLVGIVSMSDALALAEPGSSARETPNVSVDNVLGMLRSVASRHDGAACPLASI